MATSSSIEWTEATWNPTTGCDRVSAGCDNCYALTLAKRLKTMGQPRYQNDGNPVTSGPGFDVTLHPDSLEAPLKWRKPKKIFVNSMSDLFHARVPISYVQEVFSVISATPQHQYQILTKRSRRLRKNADKLIWPSNLWMGVTVEDEFALDRVDDLREVPASVRFLSCEPLLGAVMPRLEGIHWVIGGGESGPNARPPRIEWVRGLRDICQQDGVAFFFKQWGGRTPKSGGRTLDGETWSQYPLLL